MSLGFHIMIRMANYRHKDVSLEQIEERISDCSNLHFALEDIRSEIRDKILTDTG